MKKIINGKKYDTNTAKLVAEHNNQSQRINKDSFEYYETELYLTSKESWFCSFNHFAKEPHISALTPKEAQQWLEDYGKDDIIENYFKIEEA